MKIHNLLLRRGSGEERQGSVTPESLFVLRRMCACRDLGLCAQFHAAAYPGSKKVVSPHEVRALKFDDTGLFLLAGTKNGYFEIHIS